MRWGTTKTAWVSRVTWLAFELWYCQYNKITSTAQQVTTNVGRVDAVSKGQIIELKHYIWSSYPYLNSVINKFIEQASRYTSLIGDVVAGQKIKEVVFYFSSKPPEAVIRALEKLNILVEWLK